MPSNFLKDDPLFGTIDLDDQYITDSWLVDKYVGGNIFTWGDNRTGALGNNNTQRYYSSPIQIGSLTNWNSVSGGQEFALSVKTDGTLWSWGRNRTGQLGINASSATVYYSSPVQVGALTNWKQVSCSLDGLTETIFAGTCAAVKTDGTLWTWGSNAFGQMGINARGNYYSSPVQVGTLNNWKQVACEAQSSCMLAVKLDGTLWSWGKNTQGQLGNGNTTYYSSPVQIGTLTDWKQVSTGRFHCAAVKTDGTLWMWGWNRFGALGQNYSSNIYYSSPIQVGALTNWKQVSCLYSWGTLAIKTDGTLWSWGSGAHGQLGISLNAVYYSSPVQVGALNNWKQVSCGNHYAAAIKTDGSLWIWGRNTYGNLGNLSVETDGISSPIQVGSLYNWKQVSLGANSTYAITFTELN